MATKIDTIKSLTYERLKNATHDEFAQFTLAAIILFSFMDSRFARNVELLRKAAAKEHDAFLWTQQKLMTEQLNDSDRERIYSLRYLRDLVKALTLGPNPGLALAAKKILLAIDEYGGTKIQSQPVEQRTGNISNLLDDLEIQLHDEVELLSITSVVQTLKENNERFIRLYSERTQALAEHGVGIMAELRAATDRCLRLLFYSVNIAAQSGEYLELKPFIDYMNVEICRLRSLIKQRSSNSSSLEVDDEELEDEVTLTFLKADETTIKLTGLTGETYEIPELTDGCIWVKADGEIEAPTGIFPAEDTNYIEVALGERKGAFYHYLNGEHETFYGLPGTEYTVPQIPEGCKWMPEPTGRIPDEDTQYFETLVSEGGSEESDGSEGSDGSEEKPKYTVNWINKDGETVKTMEVEAGTKLTSSDYPRAASGYEWQPSWIGGGLTINGDTTIREVVIEDMGV